jgi:hypothetical protein
MHQQRKSLWSQRLEPVLEQVLVREQVLGWRHGQQALELLGLEQVLEPKRHHSL